MSIFLFDVMEDIKFVLEAVASTGSGINHGHQPQYPTIEGAMV
jgi:hypothetical protein